jgi:hypothetical protein
MELTNGWYKSINDTDIIVNDKFPRLKSNDGKTYPLRVKANPNTGNFDYYWKGGGNGLNGAGIGGDVLMFQAAPLNNTIKIIFTPKNGFKYDDFYKGTQENYNHKIFEKTKEELYTQASASQRQNLDKIPAYSGFKETTPEPPENPPGADANQDTSGSGSGAPSGTPAIFEVTSKDFQSENEKFKPGFLKYPLDMSSGQDRIVIVQRRYRTPEVLNGTGLDINKIIAGGFSKERFGNDIEEPTESELIGTAVLPMPNDISETNVTAWGEDSLSSLAALVGGASLGAVSGLANFNLDAATQNIMRAASNALSNDTAANETIKQLLALNAAAAVTQKFGININPEAFRSRITGTAINPNLELLFQGPKLRSFGFQFKMTPRSQEEARNIRYILKFFKKGMAAKRSGGKAAYFLGAPNVFDIHFRGSESNNDLKSIGKIKTCALQQCVVNYTPDGFYAAFNDRPAGGSQPIAVTMQLAFTELTPLYNDNYDANDENTVGYDILKDVSFGTTQNTGGGTPAPPGPPGQVGSPAQTLIQGTGANQPPLGLPGA